MSKYIIFRLVGIAILLMLFTSFGCAHRYYYKPDYTQRFYVPKEIPLKPGMVLKPEFNAVKSVILLNTQNNKENIFLGAYTHKWWGNLNMWTDTAVGLVKSELEKKETLVTEGFPTVFEICFIESEEEDKVIGIVKREIETKGVSANEGFPAIIKLSINIVNMPDSVVGLIETGLEERDVSITEGQPEILDFFIVSEEPTEKVLCLFKNELSKQGISLSEYSPKVFKFDTNGVKWNEIYSSILSVLKQAGITLTNKPPDIRKFTLVTEEAPDTVLDVLKSEFRLYAGISKDGLPYVLRFSAPAADYLSSLCMLKSDLARKGIIIIEGPPKVLKLSITRANLVWKFRTVECNLNLNVETGDGYTVNFEETNSSTDLYDSCDGAVTKAVAAMFNNDSIRYYLTYPSDLIDSDCDGVPDYIDECPNTPFGVKVDSRGCPLDSDGDGVPDYLDECPGTPEGVEVDAKGCPPDTDGDGVLDGIDLCPDTPKGARVDENGCWIISETLFDFDKYIIKPIYYQSLDDVYSILEENPELRIEIKGHADIIGTESYNQRLSENRARAVMEYLVNKGIDPERLSTAGYSFHRPIASNETEEGRALNRRVELSPIH